MLESKKSRVSSKYLASICRSNPSFFAKLTISANYQKRTPHIADAILLTIEYLQLYAQIWLINYYVYDKPSESSVQLHYVLTQFSRILLPGGLFKVATDKGTIEGLFLFCLLFSILRILLVVHVASAAKRGEKLRSKIATIWNWFFHFSARVIYTFMVSFWVITIQHALKNNLGFDNFTRYCLITIPGALLIFELLISIIIERNLSYNLPTKRFMSRKESVVETITVVQKLINQTVLILYVTLTNHLLFLAWFCNIYNCLFCILRDFHFLRNFPLYNLKALKYEACLLVLTTCQSLAYLIQTLLRVSYDEKIDPNFGVIAWMILGVLGVLLVNKNLKGIFFTIAMNKCAKKWNSNLMIHKAFIMKDIFKNHKLPSHQNQDHSFKHLMSQALSIHAQVILEKADNSKLKKSWHKFFVGYFEYLSETFPKNDLVKLILAWFYIKKMELYGPGIRILHSLINSKDKSTVFNASLLIYELEKGTLASYKGDKSKLDLGEYTKSISAVIDLKNLMLNQAKLHLELCSGVTENSPDLFGVFKSAQNIYQAREKVEKKIKKMFNIVPEYYLEPYKLCAYYHLSLNFSSEASNNYEKLYSRISHKYERSLSSKELTQHTLYDKNTNLYLVSGAKANMGVITYNSKGCQKFIENPIIGAHVGSLCPKGLRKFYTATVNTTIEEGNKFFLDRIHNSFYYNFPTLESSPMRFYMNIVPYFTEGLHYAFVSFPTRLPFELVTFLENGEIESYTPGIARALNLPQAVRKGRVLNIGDVSEELGRVNEAFNIVKNSNENSGELTLEEAKEIYQIYTTEGKILNLKPLNNSGQNERVYTYQCKLIEKVPGSTSLRRIMFEKTESKGVESQNTPENHDDINEKVQSEFDKEEGALSPRDQILTSTRAFIPTQYEQNKSPEHKKKRSISDILELDNRTEDENSSSRNKPKINHHHHQQEQQQSISSRTSSSSSDARLSRTLNEALGNPYYPISHRILIALIGVLFLSILISQIAVKLIMDQETGNLETKKEVLRSAQGRNDYLVNIDRKYRYFDGAIKGYYTTSDFTPARLLGFAIPNTSSLAQENANLLDLAKVLSVENQEKLFEKNVRVYGTDSGSSNTVHVKFTSFQVTDQIVQASLKAINLIQEDIMKSERELRFIFRNAVNDLLLVGEEIAGLFLESINSQISVLKTKIGQTWIIALGFVSVVGIISLMLIYREYCQEIINLSAFVKVNKKGVAIVSTKMIYFAKLIEDEVHFEDIKDTSLLNNSGMFDSFGKLKVKVKEEARIPNSRKIKSKYQLLVMKEIVLLAILMALISLMVSLVNGYISLFSKTLNQIYFLDRMIYKFDLATSTYFDMLVENGTSYVRNQLSPVEFKQGIKAVAEVQTKITEELKNHDGDYDPVIESMLFDNVCDLLGEPDSTNCMKGGGKAGFIQLISNFEAVLNNMLNQYQVSNKSSSSLAKLILTTDVPNSMRAITFIYKMMAERLNQNFSKQIGNYEARKLQMVIIICIVTALVCIFKYVTVLRELEGNLFQFRKALRLFPPRLILSNFMLKAFLIKTTNGSFNWFKSDL